MMSQQKNAPVRKLSAATRGVALLLQTLHVLVQQ